MSAATTACAVHGTRSRHDGVQSVEVQGYNREFRGRLVTFPTVTGLGTPTNIDRNFLWVRNVPENVCPLPGLLGMTFCGQKNDLAAISSANPKVLRM